MSKAPIRNGKRKVCMTLEVTHVHHQVVDNECIICRGALATRHFDYDICRGVCRTCVRTLRLHDQTTDCIPRPAVFGNCDCGNRGKYSVKFPSGVKYYCQLHLDDEIAVLD
jgi:hypothetical protein